MESLRKGIRWMLSEGSWRLTLFLLPWQTRWFSEGPLVNGYPWEQGRISIYASWIPLFITCLFAVHEYVWPAQDHSAPLDDDHPSRQSKGRLPMFGWGGLCLLVISSVLTISFRATFQWWVECLALIGFSWSLLVLRVPLRSLVSWILFSLTPHLLLGVGQFFVQFIHGSKWLGISTQNPFDRGVSVIQFGDQRVLRAYGGFPHPNIFGAWIAFGMMLGLWMWRCVKRDQRWLLALFLGLSSVALVISFSRSAWIAACLVGVSTLIVTVIFSHPFQMDRGTFKDSLKQLRSIFIPFCLILGVCGITFFFQREKILVRLRPTTTRLEAKSIDERQAALQHGWELSRDYPLFGTGPGTANLALSRLASNEPLAPPVPPHFIPLLILDELGVIGTIGIVLLCVWHVVRRTQGDRLYRIRLWICFLPVLPFFFLDHFLWSVWSGKVLFALIWLFSCLWIKADRRT